MAHVVNCFLVLRETEILSRFKTLKPLQDLHQLVIFVQAVGFARRNRVAHLALEEVSLRLLQADKELEQNASDGPYVC